MEVAHFVRSIAIYPNFDEPETWSTPDVMLTMRQGQLHDHALLMASMFRAVKYETFDELKAAFIRDQTKRNLAGGKSVIKIMTKAGISQNMTEVNFDKEEDAEDDDEEEEKSEGEKGETDGDDDDDDEDKAGSEEEGDENDESVADESDVDIQVDDDDAGAGGAGGDGELDDNNETMEERVFVCIGRFKKEIEKQAVWVMTFDKEFQEVTMWNPV